MSSNSLSFTGFVTVSSDSAVATADGLFVFSVFSPALTSLFGRS